MAKALVTRWLQKQRVHPKLTRMFITNEVVQLVNMTRHTKKNCSTVKDRELEHSDDDMSNDIRLNGHAYMDLEEENEVKKK